MSKPIVRVTLAILISLVLIAATYMTVQGAWAKSDTGSAHAHVVNGLQTSFDHYRSTISELQTQNDAFLQSENGPHQGGGCHSDYPTSSDE